MAVLDRIRNRLGLVKANGEVPINNHGDRNLPSIRARGTLPRVRRARASGASPAPPNESGFGDYTAFNPKFPPQFEEEKGMGIDTSVLSAIPGVP